MPDAAVWIDESLVWRGDAGVDPAHGLIDGADVSGGGIAERDDGAETWRLLLEHLQGDDDDA